MAPSRTPRRQGKDPAVQHRLLRLLGWAVAVTATLVALNSPYHPYEQAVGLLLAGSLATHLATTRKGSKR